MKKCPGTIINPGCGNKLKNPQARLCDKCLQDVNYMQNLSKEVLKEKRLMGTSLINNLVGVVVNVDRMLSDGWHDQGSANYFFGLPQRKGLWVKKVDHQHFSERGGKILYLLLLLTKSSVIKSIETEFYQIHPDGSMCKFDEGLTDADCDAIEKICRKLIEKKGKYN